MRNSAPTRKRQQRRYSDDFRASALAALAANGGNVKKTARQLGIPLLTLWTWSKHPQISTSRNEKKGELADAIEQVAWQIVDQMPDKIAKASLRDLATCLGIAVDKMRLLREQATAITDKPEELSDDQRFERLKQLALRIQQRRLAPADGRGTGGISPPDNVNAGGLETRRTGSPADDPGVGQTQNC